ncbi:MAG: DUF177 domain-containing protein [Acidimicrobiales bacterium]|nr:DUF177 domain-containing protein [Acidimicrobiales bacterium]MDG2217225.1 DUF177 domain-containing protein [Acidimicrobiales bacterium]
MSVLETLIVDIVELRRRTGTRREVAATLMLDDMAVSDRSVVDGRIDVALTIEAMTEGIVAYGKISGVTRVPCRRCLDDVDGPMTLDFHEIFESEPTDGETWPINDERIDLTPVIREAALLSLPLAPVCGDDCVGPEPARFPTGAYKEAEPVKDDRWAALDGLHFDE